MVLMRRSQEINSLVKGVIQNRQIKEEALAQAIGKARQTLNKKLNGLVPLFYDEVVAMSEFLGMPDLAGKDTEPPAKWDPAAQTLLELLSMLPKNDRRDLYRVAVIVLKGKVQTKKKKEKIKTLEGLSK